MGPGNNTWFSFGYPPLQPIEMLLFDRSSTSCSGPPPSPPTQHPLGDYLYHPISYAYHLLPPLPAAPVKCEDLLHPGGVPRTAHEIAPPTMHFGAAHDLHVAPASDGAGFGSDSAEDDSVSAATGCNAGFVSSGRSTPDDRHDLAISTGPLATTPEAPGTAGDGGWEMTKTVTAAASPPAGAGHRTSAYRGVTRHRWTGRYEAHLWDNTCRREGQKRKGRQVYLGGYEREEKAARAYDLAALKYWGPSATTNFPISTYEKEIEDMKCMPKQEFIASIRRNSSGFSRGASIYRGVTRHHQHGRWQARIGRVAGNKDLYLGTFATEEEAAEAYDVAAIKFRGANAVTNFELGKYDVEAIMNTDLPIGASGKRIKQSIEVENNQLATMSCDPKHMNIIPSAFLQNVLHFGGSRHGYCSLEESDQDACRQNLYLFTATDQRKGHIHNPHPEGSGILQLIDFSSSLCVADIN